MLPNLNVKGAVPKEDLSSEIEEGVKIFKEKIWELTLLNKETKDKFLSLIKEGATKREACRETNIPYQDFSRYLRGDEEFKISLINAFEDSIGWYDQQARTNLTNRNFNTSLYFKMVENQKMEKLSIVSEHEKDIVIEEYLRKLLELTIKEEIGTEQFIEKANCIKSFQTCVTIENMKKRIEELEILSRESHL